MAVQASPKAFDWRTSSWHRLAFASSGDTSIAAPLAMWHPWEPVTQTLRQNTNDARGLTRAVGGGYLLSQRGWYAINYGERLVMEGNIEAARFWDISLLGHLVLHCIAIAAVRRL